MLLHKTLINVQTEQEWSLLESRSSIPKLETRYQHTKIKSLYKTLKEDIFHSSIAVAVAVVKAVLNIDVAPSSGFWSVYTVCSNKMTKSSVR